MNNEAMDDLGTDQTVSKILINDPLIGKSIGKVTAGKFVGKQGWQASDKDCRVVYVSPKPIMRGYLEAAVINFNPPTQQVYGKEGGTGKTFVHRHHILHANADQGLDHHALCKASGGVVLHCYHQSNGHQNFKLMNFRCMNPRCGFEGSLEAWSDDFTHKHIKWDPKHRYIIRLAWDVNQNTSWTYLDGVLVCKLVSLYDPQWAQEAGVEPNTKFLAPQYFAVGSDLTHSIDHVDPKSMMPGNRYQTMRGPIWSAVKIASL